MEIISSEAEWYIYVLNMVVLRPFCLSREKWRKRKRYFRSKRVYLCSKMIALKSFCLSFNIDRHFMCKRGYLCSGYITTSTLLPPMCSFERRFPGGMETRKSFRSKMVYLCPKMNGLRPFCLSTNETCPSNMKSRRGHFDHTAQKSSLHGLRSLD